MHGEGDRKLSLREICHFCGNDVWIPYDETECCQVCSAIKFDRYIEQIEEIPPPGGPRELKKHFIKCSESPFELTKEPPITDARILESMVKEGQAYIHAIHSMEIEE